MNTQHRVIAWLQRATNPESSTCVHMSLRVRARVSVCVCVLYAMSLWGCVGVSVCLSVSVCLAVSLFVCLVDFLFVCVCVHLRVNRSRF